jgi:hypothetical protein
MTPPFETREALREEARGYRARAAVVHSSGAQHYFLVAAARLDRAAALAVEAEHIAMRGEAYEALQTGP